MNLRLDSPITLLTFGLAMLLATAGCDSAPECSDCPPLAGSWTMEFSNVGALPEGCAAIEVPTLEGPLELTQVGAALNGTLDGVEVRGSVLTTWEFTLNGSTGAEGDGGTARSLALNGRYGPETTPDAGDRLVGNLTQSLHAGDDACMFTRGYTATRTP